MTSTLKTLEICKFFRFFHKIYSTTPLVDKIPPGIYGASSSCITKIDFNQDSLTLCFGYVTPGAVRFILKYGEYVYEQSCFKNFKLNEQRLGVQTPTEYSLAWQGKRERFGLSKPSSDGVIRFVTPNWIVEDADTETYKLISNYYKNDYNPDFLQRSGCKSFYDYTEYIPYVDYSISKSTLVTSYHFKDCYFPGNPMQKAKVCGGVNIYEIDPEAGQKKVFALTTRKCEDLEPVPVVEGKTENKSAEDGSNAGSQIGDAKSDASLGGSSASATASKVGGSDDKSVDERKNDRSGIVAKLNRVYDIFGGKKNKSKEIGGTGNVRELRIWTSV